MGSDFLASFQVYFFFFYRFIVTRRFECCALGDNEKIIYRERVFILRRA